jgi:hypothetical protein
MKRRHTVFFFAALSIMAACSGRQSPSDASAPLVTLEDAACNGRIVRGEEQSSPHVAPGTPIAFRDNPPVNGTHYDVWARWGIYREAIPRGYWVHNLEHGAIVIAYKPELSSAERDRLEAFVRALPPEPECAAQGVRRRIIVTPDPMLPTRVAALAWNHAYTADCVDEAALERVVLGLTGRAPENVCADGFFPLTDPDAGLPDGAAHIRDATAD